MGSPRTSLNSLELPTERTSVGHGRTILEIEPLSQGYRSSHSMRGTEWHRE
jgi:hypothetical protein